MFVKCKRIHRPNLLNNVAAVIHFEINELMNRLDAKLFSMRATICMHGICDAHVTSHKYTIIYTAFVIFLHLK